MKNIISAALVAAAIGSTIGATITAVPASGHTARALSFVSHDAHFQFIDIPPKGGKNKPPTQGDEFAIGGVLTQHGVSVGTTNLVCTVTEPGASGLSACSGMAVIPGGTLAIQGVSRLAGNSDTYAITGGTGKYMGAEGEATSVQKGSGDQITITLR